VNTGRGMGTHKYTCKTMHAYRHPYTHAGRHIHIHLNRQPAAQWHTGILTGVYAYIHTHTCIHTNR